MRYRTLLLWIAAVSLLAGCAPKAEYEATTGIDRAHGELNTNGVDFDSLPDHDSPYFEDAKSFFVSVAAGTRAEVVLIRISPDDMWQRIGPFVVDDPGELAKLRKAVLRYKAIEENNSPFLTFDREETFVIEWLTTSPPYKSGNGRIMGLGAGGYCVTGRSERFVIRYGDMDLFKLLEQMAMSRVKSGKAFLLERPE